MHFGKDVRGRNYDMVRRGVYMLSLFVCSVLHVNGEPAT